MTNATNGIPTWVFILFFTLIYLGYLQSKTRKVARKRIVVLPFVMIALSINGVLSVPAHSVTAFTAWAIGVAAAVAINAKVPHGSGVTMHEDQQHFLVPGSWIPLMLMMTVFIAKGTIGYLVGSHTINPENINFIEISSVVSGMISGTFLARALFIFKAGSAHATQLLHRSTGAI